MFSFFRHVWSDHRHVLLGILGVFALTVAVFFLQTQTADYVASILNVKKPAPFDGTALPIREVPDWTALTGTQAKLLAADIPSNKKIATPNYDPAIFGTQVAALDWKASKNLINQLITYAVPYMGSYETGSKEQDGSHLAVDIKIPEGTDVFAIANGKVVKVAESSSGFGKHIVIEHPDVPLVDSNTTTTLYSAYAHLSQILVMQGDIVTRGQLIAKSGNTGTSTTPHLHFQIDNSNAPWHPWWPFSSAEASAAGLNFFTGISSGLGREAALKNTVNPMLWVQKYLSSKPVATSTSDLHATAGTSDVTTDDNEQPTTDDTTVASTSNSTTTATKPTFKISGETFALAGNSASIQIKAHKTDGSIDTSFAPSEEINLQASGKATLKPETLTASDFKNGVAKVSVQDSEEEQISVTIADTNVAHTISFVEKVGIVASFRVTTDDAFLINSDETVTIQALDSAGNPTPSSMIAGTVRLMTSTGDGKFTPETLTSDNFTEGRAMVTLNYPTLDNFSIKAQEGALLGESATITSRLFTDVSASHTNIKAIAYLKNNDIISGYPDGSFGPEKTVSRVEALKMILLGLGIELDPGVDLTFPDTEGSAWYAPFVKRAVKLEIAKGYPDGTFGPAKSVNRAEYLKILLNSSDAETSTPEETPYSDMSVSDWFAPFAAYSKAKNILPTSDNELNGSGSMSRADVAETIYRMIVLKKTGAESYSEDLNP